ncbi:hypothetical protein KPL47_14620 [Clostridium estertheticum]|uniref:hypothetical protein n=1 Tax=Clostridium estertheticum TaxID=238834 RepID=UPI001C0A9BB5|nr:hypothetical protein [Clostridium estertheticum]MBU3177567.1 hypothetical protein [Clostridium estertheticum]
MNRPSEAATTMISGLWVSIVSWTSSHQQVSPAIYKFFSFRWLKTIPHTSLHAFNN